jgi:outer membrane receptor protein involved in Fe transport
MRSAAVLLVFMLGLGLSSAAFAQSLTTGAIQGRVTDKESEEPLPFVTVTVGSQSVTTDEDGNYKITDLLPGKYDVAFEFDTTSGTRTGIVVNANSTTTLHEELKIGEAIHIDGTPPPIRTTRHDKVTTVDRDQLTSLPVPGTSFDDATGQTPGSSNDGTGTALSGSSGLENRYLVDGIDITGLTIGDVGTPVLNEFVHEIQIVSGGYNAEYGRATGGIINVITRSGTDELRGSVFGQLTPGLFTARRHASPSNSSSIDITGDNVYSGQVGFELGGPIVKKRAWFYLGAAPQSSRTDFTRTTKRQTDCRLRLDSGELSTCDPANGDGDADVDPKTGFYITDTIDSELRSSTAKSTQVIGKINALVTPNNQVQLSVIALPSSSKSPSLSGLPSTGTRSWGLTTDSAARWTAKLDDGGTEIEGIATWHRSTYNTGSIDPSYDSTPLQVLYGSDLSRLSSLGGESAQTIAGCADGAASGDPYPLITNCPMNTSYTTGGPGGIAHDKEERFGARASVVHRFKALGTHELKTGLDYEDNRKRTARLYSGGALIQNYGSSISVSRYVEVAPPGSTDPSYDKICTTPDPSGGTGGSANAVRELTCRYVGGTVGEPGTLVDGQTLNWGTYLQDSWQPARGLVLNAGVRYEEQRLRYAERLRGAVDALTGNRLGDRAMTLRGNFAPRLGAIWDPTKEGRSKIYTAWGRYYEAIPMDINDRSFGGELSMTQTYDPGACGGVDLRTGFADGTKCLTTSQGPEREELIGSRGVLIAPGIKAQFMDETLIGAELALPSNVVVGLTAQHRKLGRVIEDVSTDGANTYIIANPGEWSETEEAKLVHAIATATDKGKRDRLERDLRMFRGIRIFDKPQRNYMALELTLSRRFMSGLYLSASYTHSKTEGNYPGLVSYDNGQIDPNISSQYDLIELLGNRRGRLPQDRPHYVKVDAYRGFDVGGGKLTLGTRVRALSGIPKNALAAHYLYGADEAFLLPRGQLGRTEFEHGIDLHVGYKKELHAGVDAELFVDVFNIYNRQGTFRVDDTYAPQYSLSSGGAGGIEQNATPISGGTYEDLLWAKTQDRNGGESSQPLGRNPNFGRTTSRYAPASAQVGFRVTF